jgi:hypothetical protein
MCRVFCGDILAAMLLTIFRGIEDREDGPGFDKIWVD